ncbi:hypothetical protein CEXT_676811 [Caerostris extrusa]|uniref:Uncharacterized protein n=1 Tax=Caerostris extrusa TaxID=172846 RepID=A0AAV4UIV4_CAEEX|nr:hypothetical protein CEXT_676811 [Caerostris extrusa]
MGCTGPQIYFLNIEASNERWSRMILMCHCPDRFLAVLQCLCAHPRKARIETTDGCDRFCTTGSLVDTNLSLGWTVIRESQFVLTNRVFLLIREELLLLDLF